MTKQETVQFQIPKKVEEELTFLRGFRDLVAERVGYSFGAKLLGKTMSEKTEAERKAVREAGKTLKESLTTLIETPTKAKSKKVLEAQEAVGEAKKKNKEKRKPHMEKIQPLRKAVKYIDNVATPDSLKELGVQVQPRFKLAEWIVKAMKK